jgi:hypothetical protein
MNWSEPIPLSRAPLFKSMLHLSGSGMRLTYVPSCFSNIVKNGRADILQQYAQPVTKKGKTQAPVDPSAEAKKLSNHAQRNLDERKKGSCCYYLDDRLLLYYVQMPRSIHFLNRSSQLVVYTLPFPVAQDNQAVPMVMFWKGKNLR